MQKHHVLQAIIVQLQNDLKIQTKAAQDAADAATHPESSAETKWDTFGLESSYLAQGQQKRVAEITEALAYFENLAKAPPSEPQFIEPNCLITLKNDEQQLFFFVAALGGGVKVQLEGHFIVVITTQTPIGVKLLGKEIDDVVQVPHKGVTSEYEIVALK